MIAVTVFFLGVATVMALYLGLTAEQPRSSWTWKRAAESYSASSSLARSSLQWGGIPGQRTGVDDLKAIGAVFIQSKEIGGRLGPSLRAAAELLTSKRRLMAEEAAQKSSVKMLLPLVLLILPAMMLIILGPAIIRIFQMLMGPAT